MSDHSADLVNALTRVADQAGDADTLDALRSLPVVLRATLAVTALSAADRPISGVTIATAAGFSRGTAYRHNRDALAAITDAVPPLVDTMLRRTRDGNTRTELTDALQQRDHTITELRAALRAAEHERDVALSYARDLHEQLAPEYQAILADKAAKVRPLRSVSGAADEPDGA